MKDLEGTITNISRMTRAGDEFAIVTIEARIPTKHQDRDEVLRLATEEFEGKPVTITKRDGAK